MGVPIHIQEEDSTTETMELANMATMEHMEQEDTGEDVFSK